MAGAVERDAAMGFGADGGSQRGSEGGGYLRRVEEDEMCASDWSHDVLRIERADGADLRTGVFAGEPLHQHGAVVLAMAAAAGGEAGIGVLAESEQRRDRGKNEGGEQDEAEEAAHGEDADAPSLRAGVRVNKLKITVIEMR